MAIVTVLIPRVLAVVLLVSNFGKGGRVFLIKPENTTVHVEYGQTSSGSFHLPCKLSSLWWYEHVWWFKNGDIVSKDYKFLDDTDDIIDTTRYRLSSSGEENRFDLFVSSINPLTALKDSGQYLCAKVSYYSAVKSKTATVRVYAIPSRGHPLCTLSGQSGLSIPVTTSQIVNVTRDSSYVLKCLSDPGVPNVTLAWMANGDRGLHSLPESGFGVGNDGLAYIEYKWTATSDLKDAANSTIFTCSLQHPGLSSNKYCSVGPFDVQYRPTVRVKPDFGIVSSASDNATFYCNIDANPNVDRLFWSYDNRSVAGDSRFHAEGTSLWIFSFGAMNNGNHTVECNAANSLGTASGRAFIIIDINTHTTDSVTQVSLTRVKGNISAGIVEGSISGALVLLAIICFLVAAVFFGMCKRRKTRTAGDKEISSQDARRNLHQGGDISLTAMSDATINAAYENDYETTVDDTSVALELSFDKMKTPGDKFGGDANEQETFPKGHGRRPFGKVQPDMETKPVFVKDGAADNRIVSVEYANARCDDSARKTRRAVDVYENIYQNQEVGDLSSDRDEGTEGKVKGSNDVTSPFENNVERLTYADLDLSNAVPGPRGDDMSDAYNDERTVYAELVI